MLQPDKLKKLNENAAKMAAAGSSQEEILAMKDAFVKQFGNEEPLKKKVSLESAESQEPQAGTTELPSADGSSAMLSQSVKDKQAALNKRALEQYNKKNKKAEPLSGLEKVAYGGAAILSELNKSVYQSVDNIINASKNSLREEGFFDEDIPDTDTPITDAIANNFNAINLIIPPIARKIINSSLPQNAKNAAIKSLNIGDKFLKDKIKETNELQDLALPKDNIPINVTKGIIGMVPDLLLAEAAGPAAIELKLEKYGTAITEKAAPLLKKLAPKALGLIERGLKSGFTKVMAAKGAIEGMADAEEDENTYIKGIKGAAVGTLEGIYMHILGEAAGTVMPTIAKGVSKAGVNSTIATAIATPLANAGVFATAKALRTGVEEQRLITAEEAATEAGTGIGFSLLHLGSQYKNHKEANHYYDNVLKNDDLLSLGRVLNETKPNLEVAYNPNLTEQEALDLTEARDEIKKAILKEPDLENKKILGDEAIRIQNQLDTHVTIDNIVKNKNAVIELINKSEELNEEQKSFYTKKAEAIADHFDNSEYGLKKKELDARINQSEKDLEASSLAFTNLTKQSDRKLAKIKIEEQRKQLEGLNAELDDLVTNKYNEDAVQKQTTDESVLRTEQPELELQGVGKGNAQPIEVTEKTITTAQPQEVVGIPDEVSQPIELSVPEKITPTETTTETAPAEEKFIIDGKEYTKEEALDKRKNRTSIPYGSKMEYNGNDPQAKEFVDSYNKDSNAYDSDGNLKGNYMMQEISKAFENLNFRKFGNLFRKYIDPNFKRSNNEKNVGGNVDKNFTWEEQASYRIGDRGYSVTEEQFRAFAKDAGITIPELTNPKAEITPVEKSPIEIQESRVKSAQSLLDEAKTKAAKKKAMTDLVTEQGRLAEMKALEKVKAEVAPELKPIDAAIKTLQESKEYIEADDIQKEKLVRATRKEFGLKEKSAPSVNRLFGKLKDIAKITMTEKAALIKQIKDTAKGARQSIQEWKKQTQELTKDLSELKKSGKITTSQEVAILNKFGKVNIFSQKSVSRFTDYMTKVFADADYKQKLSNARKTLSSIKDLSKNEKKNGNLRALGSEFAKIDPSIVENIDEYNNIASKIKEAIDGSKIRKANVKFAETVNIENATEYIEKTLKEQEAKLREEKINELQDLLDVDASEFSAEEIDNLLDIYGEEKGADTIKYNEGIIRTAVKKAFDIYSTVIKEMVRTGEDVFTGEKVVFDKKQKDLIKRFMNIDPSKISDPREALGIVDSLINFIQNKSTAGMLKPIADYEQVIGGNELVKKGFEAIPLKKYWNNKLGRLFGEKTTTLPVLFEKMFKGVNAALKVENAIGVSDLINNKSIGQSQANGIIKDYVKNFYNKKANGEEFNSAYNDVERGVLAHIMRNVIGSEAEMKKEFDTRKQEVKEGIDLMVSEGNEQEREIGKLAKKAYDKILSDSETIEDVKNKVDKENLNGVEHWIKEWDKKYEALSDLSINFYNKELGKGINYTPDRVRKLQGETKDVDLEDNESAFIKNTDGALYNKKSGSLMDKSKDRKIPKNMHIDFSFDKKNANSMYDALIDLNTAFDVRKVNSFLKSDNFKKIFPSNEDANVLKKRIEGFVRNSRKKTPYSGSELSGFLKAADKLATIGVSTALASPTQPFKQTIPVAISTAINAGSVGIGAAFNPSYNLWLNNLGYAISNRGLESQAEIESINKLIDKAASSKKEAAFNLIKEANAKMLNVLLVKPDIAIARASFKAYYEQSLKKQGLKSSNIDYDSHEVNKDAANYAQRMVDRQQNISDHDLAGDLFTTKSNATKVFVKMLMPFSSFRMNQSSRLGSDLTTLEYWNTSTKEDKIVALRSISGYAAESLAYRGLQIGASMLMYGIAKKIMGAPDDEEEDKRFKDNLIKGGSTGAFIDTFSPIPLTDPYMQDALAYSAEELQDIVNIPDEEKVKLFGSKDQSAVKILGTYGIPIEKAMDIYSLGKLAYSRKFKDKYGKEKEISQKDADNLKILIGPLMAASVTGFASSDISSITRKATKMAQKEGQSTESKGGSYEDYKKYEEKRLILDDIIENSYDENIVDAAEQKKKELQYSGTEYQKSLNQIEKMKKEKLLVDPETGTEYDNEGDLKKYNETLWNENFGPNSDWEQEHKDEDEVDKMLRDALTKKEEEEYEYVKPKRKKRKNSDGTRRRSK